MSIFVEDIPEINIGEFINELQNQEYRGARINLLPKLDKAIYGLNTGMYYLLAGMSKSGKTTVTIQIIYSVLYDAYVNRTLNKTEFVYFELEINRTMLIAQFTSLALFVLSKGEIAIGLSKLIKLGNNKLTNEELKMIEPYNEIITKMVNRIRFVPKRQVSKPNLFDSKCRDILEYNGEIINDVYVSKITTYFIIDHISILGNNQKTPIDEISTCIVDLKNEYNRNAVFIALQQINRDMYSPARRSLDGDNIEVTPNDLKDSGVPMQDCDFCVAIFNPYELKNLTSMSGYDLERSYQGLRRFDFVKARYGELYSIRFYMSGGRFIKELEDASDEQYLIIYKLYKIWQT